MLNSKNGCWMAKVPSNYCSIVVNPRLMKHDTVKVAHMPKGITIRIVKEFSFVIF